MSDDVTQAEPLALAGAAGSLRGDRWDVGGDRGALLMLHGGGQTRHSWDLLVRGGISGMVSDDAVGELVRLIAAASVVDAAGAAHMVAGDDNGVFVVQMTEFLRSLPAGDVA